MKTRVQNFFYYFLVFTPFFNFLFCLSFSFPFTFSFVLWVALWLYFLFSLWTPILFLFLYFMNIVANYILWPLCSSHPYCCRYTAIAPSLGSLGDLRDESKDGSTVYDYPTAPAESSLPPPSEWQANYATPHELAKLSPWQGLGHPFLFIFSFL